MQKDYMRQMEFLREMSDYQTSGYEFFSRVLLESLKRHFDLHHVVIYFFDHDNHFLSSKTIDAIDMDSDLHPYHTFQHYDTVRQTIYKNARKNHQTFNHFDIKGYLSSELIQEDYESSDYVQFIQNQFKGYYSLSYAFGINGYIQMSCFKTKDEGDFTQTEIEQLNAIYLDVANIYKNFKKYVHAKILLAILSEIVSLDVKAYIIIDNNMNIMEYNQEALDDIRDILGPIAVQEIQQENYCQWLPSLISHEKNQFDSQDVIESRVKNYDFKIHKYDEQYPCGIVETFYWMSISKAEDEDSHFTDITLLTPTEQKVAYFMYQGLTYQGIADELVISYHTVKNHVQNIYHKCNVTNRYELYKWMENQK